MQSLTFHFGKTHGLGEFYSPCHSTISQSNMRDQTLVECQWILAFIFVIFNELICFFFPDFTLRNFVFHYSKETNSVLIVYKFGGWPMEYITSGSWAL